MVRLGIAADEHSTGEGQREDGVTAGVEQWQPGLMFPFDILHRTFL
jgi:hypothetical protein